MAMVLPAGEPYEEDDFFRRLHWRNVLRYGGPCVCLLVPTLHTQPTIQGISTVLFFQCMFALFNPANCTRRVVKWGLVAHTTAMFSLFAAPITVYIKQQSFFYIDFREYLGGPSDENIIFPEAIFLCIMFPPSQWLADGLLVSSVSS